MLNLFLLASLLTLVSCGGDVDTDNRRSYESFRESISCSTGPVPEVNLPSYYDYSNPTMAPQVIKKGTPSKKQVTNTITVSCDGYGSLETCKSICEQIINK